MQSDSPFESPKISVPKEISVRCLQKELKPETSNWYRLGFHLRVDVDKIEAQLRITPDICFFKVIGHFLANGNGTWQDIFDALEEDDYGRLMRELKEKYNGDMKVTLDAKDLSTLLKDVIPKWSVFGINLDIPPPVLDAFKDDKPVDQLFREMLGVWMKGNPYWQDLVEALKQIGNRRLAMQIENKYIKEVPDDTSNLQLHEHWYTGVEENELEEDSHFAVLSAITSVVKWEDLGLALGLKSSKLLEIKINNREQVSECRKDMLRVWLKSSTATWKNLCLALDSSVVGESNLARDIAKKHKGPQQAINDPARVQKPTTPITATEQDSLPYTTAITSGSSMFYGTGSSGSYGSSGSQNIVNIQTDENVSKPKQNVSTESMEISHENEDSSGPEAQVSNKLQSNGQGSYPSNTVSAYEETQPHIEEVLVPGNQQDHSNIIYSTSNYAKDAITEVNN